MATRPDNVMAIQDQKRRYPRTRVVWPATLRTTIGTLDCLVLDISANGAKLQFPAPPGEIEGPVMLALPRLPGFNAIVAWSHPDHGMEIGVTFDDPPGEVAALLASVLPNSSAVRFNAIGDDAPDDDDWSVENGITREEDGVTRENAPLTDE